MIVRNDQGGRARVGDDAIHLARLRAEADRHGGGAARERREERFGEPDRVRQQERDTIAGSDPGLGERRRSGGGARREVGVGDRVAFVLDRGACAERGDRIGEQSGQRAARLHGATRRARAVPGDRHDASARSLPINTLPSGDRGSASRNVNRRGTL